VDALPDPIRSLIDPIRAANEALKERKQLIANAIAVGGEGTLRWRYRESLFYRVLQQGSEVISFFSFSVFSSIQRYTLCSAQRHNWFTDLMSSALGGKELLAQGAIESVWSVLNTELASAFCSQYILLSERYFLRLSESFFDESITD